MFRDQSGQLTQEEVDHVLQCILESKPIEIYPLGSKELKDKPHIVFKDGEEP